MSTPPIQTNDLNDSGHDSSSAPTRTKRNRSTSVPVPRNDTNRLKRSGSDEIENVAEQTMPKLAALGFNAGSDLHDRDVSLQSATPTSSGGSTPPSEKEYDFSGLSRGYSDQGSVSPRDLDPSELVSEKKSPKVTSLERTKRASTLLKPAKKASNGSLLGGLSRSTTKSGTASKPNESLLGGLKKATTVKHEISSNSLLLGVKKGRSSSKSVLPPVSEEVQPAAKDDAEVKKLKRTSTKPRLTGRSRTDSRMIDRPATSTQKSHKNLGHLKLLLKEQTIPDWLKLSLVIPSDAPKSDPELFDLNTRALFENREPIDPNALLTRLHQILELPYSFYVLDGFLKSQIKYLEGLKTLYKDNLDVLRSIDGLIVELTKDFEPYKVESNGFAEFKGFLKKKQNIIKDQIKLLDSKKRILEDEKKIQLLKLQYSFVKKCSQQTSIMALTNLLIDYQLKHVEVLIKCVEMDIAGINKRHNTLTDEARHLMQKLDSPHALEFLKNSIYPEIPSDDLERPHFEATLTQMARFCVESEAPILLTKGSGTVYILKYRGTPKFVFKTVEGAPGMPEKPIEGWVERDVPSNRAGFPTGLQFRGEIAAGLLGYSSAILAKLKLDGKDKVGTLLPYIDHVCTFDELLKAVQDVALYHPDAKSRREKEILLSKLNGSANADETQKAQLVEEIKELKVKIEAYIDSKHRSVDLATLIKFCLETRVSDQYPASSLRVWEMPSIRKSLKSLYLEDFYKPNMDRNADNYFIVKNQSGEFEIKGYDDDCCFPDTWMKPVYPTHLLTSHAKEVVLSTLCPLITRKKARIDFERLKLWGLHYTGDTYEIMKARSIVLELGHKANKTLFEIGAILSKDTMKEGFSSLLHQLLYTAKDEVKILRLDFIRKYSAKRFVTERERFLGVEDKFWNLIEMDKLGHVKCDSDGYPIFNYWKNFEAKIQEKFASKSASSQAK